MKFAVKGNSKQAGFTLLELLISIAIISLIMTTAFAAIRIGDRSWVAGQERTDAVEEMRSFAEFLRRRTHETIATSWKVSNETRIAFTGQRQLMRFIAPAPSHAAGPGLLSYALRVDNAQGESHLRLEYRPLDPGANAFDESPAEHSIAFDASFASVTFEFYGAIEDDSRVAWYSDWPANAELFPSLIRISFDAPDGAAAWPDLVVPLHGRAAL